MTNLVEKSFLINKKIRRAKIFFYPRLVFAFGCHSLPAFVCMCQRRFCPRDNLSPVKAGVTAFGQEVQKILGWDPYCFQSWFTYPLKSNKFNTKVKINHSCRHPGMTASTPGIYRGYPGRRALSAMRKHGVLVPFGRIPSICVLQKELTDIERKIY